MEKKHSYIGLGGFHAFSNRPIRSFRDLPIKSKVGIPVAIAILILVFNHLLGFYFKDQQSDSDEWINTIARNQLQSQQIEQLLSKGDFTDENTLNELQAAIFQIESRLKALASGGNLSLGEGKVSSIAPIYTSLKPGLNYVEDQWTSYKRSLEELLVRSEALNRSRTVYKDSISVQRIQTLAGYLENQERLLNIEGLSQGFIRQCDVLIEEIKQKSSADIRTAQILEIVFMIINVISILSVLTVISRYILYPVKKLANTSRAIASGELDVELDINSHDEIGEIATATKILKDNLHEATTLTIQIGEGNYDAHLATIDEEKVREDTLFGALLSMRQQLKKVTEEERRRSWATSGLAKFSEILRSDFADFRSLADKVISELVQYVNANQGGIFMLNDEDDHLQYLEQIGCYAYGKKRFFERKIKLRDGRAEGLLGQAFLERDTIYLTDVPDRYVSITSGLGEATPTSVLIVPLKYNDRVEGVIELASFHVFEPYKIEFVEKLAASITATIEATKRSDQMKKLLTEAQIRTEEMRAQEEEMRQNMEELHATQEEMQRNEAEMQQRVKIFEERETFAIREKEKIECLLAQLPAMVYQLKVHPSGMRQFLYVSEGIKKLFGMPKEEFKGDATLINLIHPEDLGTFHNTLDRALADLTLWQWEGRFMVNGNITWLATIARPEEVEDGALLFHGVFTDIEDLFTNDEEVTLNHERLEKFKLFKEE